MAAPAEPGRFFALHIVIFFPLGEQEDDRDRRGEDLRRRNGVPDAVHAEDQRQEDDGRGLEHQRPQNEITAEMSPLFNAVKNEDAKILKPANRNANENSRNA